MILHNLAEFNLIYFLIKNYSVLFLEVFYRSLLYVIIIIWIKFYFLHFNVVRSFYVFRIPFRDINTVNRFFNKVLDIVIIRNTFIGWLVLIHRKLINILFLTFHRIWKFYSCFYDMIYFKNNSNVFFYVKVRF